MGKATMRTLQYLALLFVLLAVSTDAGRRGRGGRLMTSGSFTMSMGGGNRAGGGEELGEDDEPMELDDADELGEVGKVNHWDVTNSGKCDHEESAFMVTDPHDHSKGECVQYAADGGKCNLRCFHKGKESQDLIEGSACAKICRLPGQSGVNCNVIKQITPHWDQSQELGEGKLTYLTRSKVFPHKAGKDADPMSCAGITTNTRAWIPIGHVTRAFFLFVQTKMIMPAFRMARSCNQKTPGCKAQQTTNDAMSPSSAKDRNVAQVVCFQ